MSDEEYLCGDCGVDLMPYYEPHEYYMVHDHVWLAAQRAGDEVPMLCIGCLEGRLGRPLTGADFTECPINQPGNCDDTPRLFKLKVEASAYFEKSPVGEVVRFLDRLRRNPDSDENLRDLLRMINIWYDAGMDHGYEVAEKNLYLAHQWYKNLLENRDIPEA